MGKRGQPIDFLNPPVKKTHRRGQIRNLIDPIRIITTSTTAQGRMTATHNLVETSALADQSSEDTSRPDDSSYADVSGLSDGLDDLPVDVDEQRAEAEQQSHVRYETKSMGKGTIHVKLRSWLPYRQTYLDELLRHDGRLDDYNATTCRGCGSSEGAQFRCLDCFCTGVLCVSCIVADHRQLPFHRVEKWNGMFFDKLSLRQLGLRVQLGHDGRSCTRPSPAHKDFVVMDTSGFHLVSFDYCNCGQGGPNHIQLLRARLFPATIERPKTAFTFDVLDTFDELSLQGKTNMYDFYYAIINKTDKSRPSSMYRYGEFSFAVRLWRHLLMLKRAGRGHDPGGAAATAPGELAVECPACPHPGRNLPDNWDSVPDEDRWLYTLFLAVDANFRLKLKERGYRDVELAPGWAYFVEEEEYQRVIALFADEIETNTCRSQHNAILAANLRNMREYRASGTGAVVCGRHSVMRKCGVGDLQKGERYSNMDYIVLSTLATSDIRDILISYDIACQWTKNFFKRIPRYPLPLRLDTSAISVRTAVPKFHLPAHGTSCQTQYSLNYLPNVGRTYGEGVESEWAHINGTAVSTREMAPAVRHETLNGHWSGWNWKKCLGFGSYFLRKLRDAVEWHERHKKNFQSLSSTVPPETVREWEVMVAEWYKNQGARDPFAEPTVETTINDVRLQLAIEDEEDIRRGKMSTHALSERALISIGLELEEKQRTFRLSPKFKNPRTSMLAMNVITLRTALYRQITQWRLAQDVYMPGAAAHRTQVPLPWKAPAEDAPSGAMVLDLAKDGSVLRCAEDVPLLLPSALPNLSSELLREIETRLRIAQADDSLETIRRLRRTITAVKAFKKLNVDGSGNKRITRIHALFNRFQAKIKLAALRYRAARAALIALEPTALWNERLTELKDEDIRGPDREKDEPSEGRFQPSWIWLVKDANKDIDGSQVQFGDSVRVEWAKAKARMDRWFEEKRLLCEEMRRVLAFFEWKAGSWMARRQIRVNLSSSTLDGIDAYAAKQASIYRNLSLSFSRQWILELRKLNNVPSWVETFPLQEQTDVQANFLADDHSEDCDFEDTYDGITPIGGRFNIGGGAIATADDADVFNEDDLLTFVSSPDEDVDNEDDCEANDVQNL